MAKLGFKSGVADPSAYALNLSTKLFPHFAPNKHENPHLYVRDFTDTEVIRPIIWVVDEVLTLEGKGLGFSHILACQVIRFRIETFKCEWEWCLGDRFPFSILALLLSGLLFLGVNSQLFAQNIICLVEKRWLGLPLPQITSRLQGGGGSIP